MKLVSMKMPKRKAEKESIGYASDVPIYPWSLKLTLGTDELKKLGINDLPEAGETVMIVGKCEVCTTSEYKTADGKTDRSIGLQITDMSVKAESDEIYDEKDSSY